MFRIIAFIRTKDGFLILKRLGDGKLILPAVRTPNPDGQSMLRALVPTWLHLDGHTIDAYNVKLVDHGISPTGMMWTAYVVPLTVDSTAITLDRSFDKVPVASMNTSSSSSASSSSSSAPSQSSSSMGVSQVLGGR
jgi:hypothetical protein